MKSEKNSILNEVLNAPIQPKKRSYIMLELLNAIESLAEEVLMLRGNYRIRSMVDSRIAEFLEVKEGNSYAWFAELAYCLLTAYSSAKRGQLCVDALCESGVLADGTMEEVAETLRYHGHRFANRRAEYIVEARRLTTDLKQIVQGFETTKEARKWLVENVKGLGWKEASHFLRNVGYMDVGIIDRHILSNMKEHGLIPDHNSKGLTKRRYLDYERLLREVADRLNMPLGELDLYLWYLKTGKVLK